jgi:hypothetical protein
MSKEEFDAFGGHHMIKTSAPLPDEPNAEQLAHIFRRPNGELVTYSLDHLELLAYHGWDIDGRLVAVVNMEAYPDTLRLLSL